MNINFHIINYLKRKFSKLLCICGKIIDKLLLFSGGICYEVNNCNCSR